MPRSPHDSTASPAPDSGKKPQTTVAGQMAPVASAETGGSVMVKDVTALKRDLRYDHAAEQAVPPVRVHFCDGRTVDTLVVLTPDQMHVISIQLEKAVVARQDALSKKPR